MTRWVSHRGVDETITENSLLSFKKAVDVGFECLETDLRVTKDGVIVLSHDDNLVRVSNQNIRISDSTFDRLCTVSLADGQKISTFEQFIENFAGQSWVFDIKPETALDTISALYRWAKKRGSMDWLVQQSRFLFWKKHHQSRFLQLFPKVECLARSSECYRAGISSLLAVPFLGGIRKGVTYALPPAFLGQNLFCPEIVERYHRQGARVMAFLPANDSEIDAAVSAGFDEVLLDGEIPSHHENRRS